MTTFALAPVRPGRLAFCALVALAVVGCDGSGYRSPTAPSRPEAPPPTPPPAPTENVSGAWQGSYTADPMDCEIAVGPATATFEQAGATVTGVLSADLEWCGFEAIHFEGTMAGNWIHGALPDHFPRARAEGRVDGDRLELEIRNSYGYASGVLRLERKSR